MAHEDKGAEAASKKQHFGDIYNEVTPVSFKTRIMDSLDYICDDYTKSEFERCGLVEFCAGVQVVCVCGGGGRRGCGVMMHACAVSLSTRAAASFSTCAPASATPRWHSPTA
jgi:hypothetical protein